MVGQTGHDEHRWARARRAAVLAAAALACTFVTLSPLLAHEIGAMKVTAIFLAGGAYDIEIVVDGEHLPPGQSPFPSLAEQAGPSGGPTVVEIEQRVEDFRRRFLDAAHVSFDGTQVRPEVVEGSGPDSSATVPVDAGSRKLAFHLHGLVPRGATSFMWAHDMHLGLYLLRVQNEGDPGTSNQWLDGGRTSQPFPLRHVTQPLRTAEVIRLYLALGFTHIVPRGLDHILFVLGIFLLSLKRRPILLQVTSFTIAHSITLGLTIYGVVSLSPRIVEPMIALSIVYVAVENLLVTEFKPWRLVIVFGFGLLHGMGFAGVLKELGLPRSEFLPALVSFNLGVEAGQLTVIGTAYLLVGVWFGRKSWYRSRVTRPASALIALVGLYWTIQRLFL